MRKEKNPRERSCPAFKKNELIYLEDEWPKDLVCLFKGKVKVTEAGWGRTQIIRSVRPFSILATRRTATVCDGRFRIEACTVCLIPMELMKISPKKWEPCLVLIQMLSVDLGVADQRVVSLTQKRADAGRIASF